MHKPQRMAVTAALVVWVATLGAVGAQTPATMEGQLLQVDPASMTFVIQTDEGDQEFAYTERTEVTGADGAAAGLATLAGQSVVVEYEESAEDTRPAMATKIAIRS